MKMTELQKALLGSFAPGVTDAVTGEPNMFTAGIDIQREPPHPNDGGTWWSQIEVYASSEDDANALRDFVLAAIDEKIARMTMHDWMFLS